MMQILLVGTGWIMLIGWLLARVLRQGRAFRAQNLPDRSACVAMPSVCVIIPARNEAPNITACLVGLAQQDYPAESVSVRVVDDNSTDDTARLVRGFADKASCQVALVQAGPLPPGWFGKPHACWLGATLSDAEWLCFMDADVRAAPRLLASAILAAEADGVDLLSVQPFQELGSMWERLIMPAGMLMIACAKSDVPSNNDGTTGMSVNGQFLLVRSAAYRQAGGHEAVRGEVCEDNGLARRMLAEGYCVRVAAGEHLARVRMYCGLASLWEGFAKNAVDIMGSTAGTAMAAIGGVIVAWSVLLVPVWLAVAASTDANCTALAGFALACVASCAAIGIQAGALRHFRASPLLLPLLPVGVTMAAVLAIDSVRLRRTGHVRWKGRVYRLSEQR